MTAIAEIAEAPELARGKRALLYAIFIVSGACGLIYETTWVRMFGLIFGSTVYSVTMVLAAFMAGLGLGSWLLGRIADRCPRPLRLYAGLEAGIGLLGAASPWLIRAIEPFYVWLYQSLALPLAGVTAVKFGLSFLMVVTPTFLMGGTFPVMNRFLIRRLKNLGNLTGALYGVNTLGAVLGTLAAAFWLLGAVGVTRAIYTAATLNLAVALAAAVWGLSSKWETTPVSDVQDSALRRRDPFSAVEWMAALAFMFSGFAALGYEVVWTRALVYVMGTSVYSFAVMLATFLLGIAVGPVIIGQFVDRMKRPLLALAIIEAAIGVASVAGLVILTAWLWHPSQPYGFTRDFLARFVGASLVMIPPALLMGAAFPVVARVVVKQRGTIAGRIGRVYSMNTLGSIAGSLVTGLVLLGAIGVWRTMLVLATVNLVVALALLGRAEMKPMLRMLTGLALAAAVLIGWPALRQGDPFKVAVIAAETRLGQNLFYGEDEYATVTVFKARRGRTHLVMDGVGMTTLTVDTQLMAHLPMAMLRHPRKALVICLGMGTTFNSARVYPELQQIDVAELDPEVVRAYRRFSDNPVAPGDPRARIHVTDGRNFLLLTRDRYDWINVDPPPPTYSAGSVLLSTRGFFELCKARLQPDGIMVDWIPGLCTTRMHRRLVRTFQDVFPHATMWLGPDGHGTYLIGTQRPLREVLDLERFVQSFSRPEVVADMAKYRDASHRIRPQDIPGLFVMGENRLRRYGRGSGYAPVMTDDRPYAEFPLQWERDDRLIDLIRDFQPYKGSLQQALASVSPPARNR